MAGTKPMGDARSGDDGRRLGWVDFAKFAAIMAVMVDHIRGVLYSDQRIQYASFYSTSLFVLVMGLTTYLSLRRGHGAPARLVRRRALGMLGPYAMATAIYSVVDCRAFVLEDWFTHLLHFDASLHLYYVSLYLHLLLVCPVLYYLLESCGRWWHEALLATSVIVVSVLTTNRSDMLGIYGGGGRLFGGTYLLLLLVGVMLARHRIPKLLSGGEVPSETLHPHLRL